MLLLPHNAAQGTYEQGSGRSRTTSEASHAAPGPSSARRALPLVALRLVSICRSRCTETTSTAVTTTEKALTHTSCTMMAFSKSLSYLGQCCTFCCLLSSCTYSWRRAVLRTCNTMTQWIGDDWLILTFLGAACCTRHVVLTCIPTAQGSLLRCLGLRWITQSPHYTSYVHS